MPRSKAPLDLVRSLIAKLGWSYGFHVGVTLALAGLALLPPQLFQYFAASLHGGAPADLALRLLGFGVALALALSVLGYVNAISRERLQLKTESLLRLAATSQLMSRPLETFDGLPRGEFLTRLGSDLSKVEGFVSTAIPMHLRYIATLMIAGWLFFSQCGPLALLPLGVVCAAAALNFIAQRKLMPLLDELRTLHGGIFQDMLQSFETVRTIRSHGASREHRDHFAGRMQGMAKKSLKAVSTAGLFDGANAFTYQVMIAACLAFAAWRVLSGKMDYATALLFPFYLGFFYSSAESLVGAIGEWNRFFVESGRLAEFLRVADRGEEAARRVPAPMQRLVARDLSIGYAGRPLSEPLQLDVELGKTVVVVGPSGCGKSTLLDVFAGLRSPLGGSISDGADQCAIVEQRACVWTGTIRSNLVIGTTEPPADETLWDALDAVGLRAIVVRNGGLDAKVDDRGLNFSEGQRYRLALARALLLPRPFLLLDEPFAALDRESIATVVRAINATKAKRGYLIVTHQIPAGLGVDEVMDFAGSGRAAYAGGVSL